MVRIKVWAVLIVCSVVTLEGSGKYNNTCLMIDFVISIDPQIILPPIPGQNFSIENNSTLTKYKSQH